MSLPDHTPIPEAAVAPTQATADPRHLRAVPETEETTEFPATAAADTATPEDAVEGPAAVEENEDGPGDDSVLGRVKQLRAPTVDRAAMLAWLKAAVTPESGLYTDRPASVGEIVRRAQHGTHLPEQGPMRAVSKGYGYVAAANKVTVRTWEWIVDHPARLAVVVVLLTVAIAFPVTRHLLGYLLAPITWVQQGLLG